MAGRAAMNKKDPVARAIEEELASPVKTVVAVPLVKAARTYPAVSLVRKELADVFVLESCTFNGLLHLSVHDRKGTRLPGKVWSEAMHCQCVELFLIKEQQAFEKVIIVLSM